GANLELRRGQRAVQYVLAVELGGVGHAVQFLGQRGNLTLDRCAVGGRVGAVGGLNSQFADTLQQVASSAQATFGRLRHRDAVVGVTCSRGIAVDLRGKAIRNCQ